MMMRDKFYSFTNSEAARHARRVRQGSGACKAEIPNPNKKATHKLLKLTVG